MGEMPWIAVVAAVICGNAVSFAFFMAALKCSKLQKTGTEDTDMPLWVYIGLIAAPATFSGGLYLLV